ncbi:hypothetical protein, partial [Paenirhodobacter populi]|uniref:hypothetical protein n=1 Tax=Paenirhodobacter populi TaxID=2306993 RepID=UPI00361B4FCB
PAVSRKPTSSNLTRPAKASGAGNWPIVQTLKVPEIPPPSGPCRTLTAGFGAASPGLMAFHSDGVAASHHRIGADRIRRAARPSHATVASLNTPSKAPFRRKTVLRREDRRRTDVNDCRYFRKDRAGICGFPVAWERCGFAAIGCA